MTSIGYTPLNECKLSRRGKDFLIECRRMRSFSVKRIHVPPQEFSDLLDSISASDRSYYSDSIPFEGKMLVRK